MSASLLSSRWRRLRIGADLVVALLCCAAPVSAQRPPTSPDRPWHAVDLPLLADARQLRESTSWIDGNKTYSLAELIDLAQSHNPDTRAAWERARAQSAALGIARSELYPTLAAAALSEVDREAILFGDTFIHQTLVAFSAALSFSYTVFDFGARAGRIDAAKADLLAANFAFNDAHRKVIFQVAQAYYQLLNASGQKAAARASLDNAQAVQQAAEERLQQGLATRPDVLEARSATAQAQYDLQAIEGAEEIAHGNLAEALGVFPTAVIQVQPLDQIPTPTMIGDTVDAAIDRALQHRPDLLQQVAEIRSAHARVKEARAAYAPALRFGGQPRLTRFHGSQPPYPHARDTDTVGGVGLSLSWVVFDGGARGATKAHAEAEANAAEAALASGRDRAANEVWTAYSQFNTALRQRQAAIALLDAASQSYDAALESYTSGVRSLLDVTAAQQTLAEARAADVLARTQVLTAVAALAFKTGDAVQAAARPHR